MNDAQTMLLLDELRKHRGYAGRQVKSKGLSAKLDPDDLIQEVALTIIWRASQGQGLLQNEVAVGSFVRTSLRNKASDILRSTLRNPAEEPEELLENVAQTQSESALRAHEIINAVRPDLSAYGELALAVSLGETDLKDHAMEHGCSIRTAYRHFVEGLAELGSRIRQAEADC